MPTTLTTHAVEQSTYKVTAAFTDDDGVSVVPTSIVWTLTDSSGTVINSRQDVSITPASSVTIALTGDDLALTSDADAVRIVTIEAVYTSDLGTGLTLKDSCRFVIDNLKAIS